jgi:hypothetical protein
MKNYLLILTAVTVLQLSETAAQQLQKREASPFNRLEIAGSAKVYYTHSDSCSLRVEARGDDLDNVETKFSDNTLRITTRDLSSDVKVYVANNRLQRLGAGGAAVFRGENSIPGDSIVFNVSGSANVKATVEARQIHNVLSGAGDLALEGHADKLISNLSGAATMKTYGLIAKQATVVASGAATAKVFVSDAIKATASGASDIRIKGDPKDVDAYTSAAASISRVKGDGSESMATEGDTVRYNLKHKKVIVIRDKGHKERKNLNISTAFHHWAGLSVGVNGYLAPSGSINLPVAHRFMELDYARSFNFQLNLFERGFRLAQNHLRLVTGLGFDYHQYAFANNTTLNADTSFTWGLIDSTRNFSYIKNRFRVTYLQVPLLLEVNTSKRPGKSFHIAFGVIGEYRIGSRTRQVLEQDNSKFVVKHKDSYNLNPFMAKAHVNFGYAGWTFFGEYALTPLFVPGKGPLLTPFTVGIRVIHFG